MKNIEDAVAYIVPWLPGNAAGRKTIAANTDMAANLNHNRLEIGKP